MRKTAREIALSLRRENWHESRFTRRHDKNTYRWPHRGRSSVRGVDVARQHRRVMSEPIGTLDAIAEILRRNSSDYEEAEARLQRRLAELRNSPSDTLRKSDQENGSRNCTPVSSS